MWDTSKSKNKGQIIVYTWDLTLNNLLNKGQNRHLKSTHKDNENFPNILVTTVVRSAAHDMAKRSEFDERAEASICKYCGFLWAYFKTKFNCDWVQFARPISVNSWCWSKCSAA